MLTGIDFLAQYIQTAPIAPGVYFMCGAGGEILYIGKAKFLRNRLRSYTQLANMNHRLQKMVSSITDISVILTQTVEEALLLEAKMISKHKPRFNILLTDGKAFSYILLSAHEYPRLSTTRHFDKKKGKQFGPFYSAKETHDAVKELQGAFMLRTCSDWEFKSRKRPCLLYQIKRCSAPCTGEIDQQGYVQGVKQATKFLQGGGKDLLEELSQKMFKASDAMQFEQAILYRQRINSLSNIRIKQTVCIPEFTSMDVWACVSTRQHICIRVLRFKDGYVDKEHTYAAHRSLFHKIHAHDILSQVLVRFYLEHALPKQVICPIVPSDYVQEQLRFSQYKGGGTNKKSDKISSNSDGTNKSCSNSDSTVKCQFLSPKQGKKWNVMQKAFAQAQEHMKHVQGAIYDLANMMGSSCNFERIEAYDNSHIMGQYCIGAMVVADAGGICHGLSHTFKMDTAGADDYEMMRRMLTERIILSSQNNANPHNAHFARHPDLVIIDGALGHIRAVREILDKHGWHDICVLGISKGVNRRNDQLWIPALNQPLHMDLDNIHVLKFVQRMRDNVHHLAINAYRKRHKQSMLSSSVQAIPSIGPVMRQRLVQAFGTAENIKKASWQDLTRVKGIGEKLARHILQHLT